LLTEQEVSRSWRKLFKDNTLTPEVIAKAEELLDELRPESPLRHRLSVELDELRQVAESKSAPPKGPAAKKTRTKTASGRT
jgi:hypothetical protein